MIKRPAYTGAEEQQRVEHVLQVIDHAVDWDAYNALVKSFEHAHPRGFAKYVREPKPVFRQLALHLVRAGLDQSSPLSVLDISTGTGMQAMAIRALGHSIYITDIFGPERRDDKNSNIALPIAFCDMFGLYAPGHFQQLIYRRDKSGENYTFSPIPDFGVKFDLIMAVAVSPMSLWRDADWKDFIIDCVQCCPTGSLYLKPNLAGVAGLTKLVGQPNYPDGSFLLMAADLPSIYKRI